MIVGIGVDLVDIARFERTLERTPRLLERLFSPAEQTRSPRSLAARYAAKEALIKALGGSDGVHWTEIEITPEDVGSPVVHPHRLDRRGDRRARHHRAAPVDVARRRLRDRVRRGRIGRRGVRGRRMSSAARGRAPRSDDRRRRDHRERAAPSSAAPTPR